MRLAATRKPDALLLSLTLRGANGVTTLASLRAQPALQDIPVVMLVPRELTSEQMEQLQAAVAEISSGRDASVRPIIELIRTALSTEREELESLQPANPQ
jgi:DNA-binding response OmpR family regulator